MKRCETILIMSLLLFSSIHVANAQNHNSLVITDDHLLLRIDLQSSSKQIDSILKLAGIKVSNVKKLLNGDFLDLNDDGWGISLNRDHVLQFERSLSDLNDNPQSKPYLITTRIPEFGGYAGYPTPVKYGINKYAKLTVYNIGGGFTRFILPGYLNTKRVFLSGSFNHWSTLKGLMKKTDGGWLIDVRLEPGPHEYKYIIDGRWRTDPNNLLEVNDGTGNVNSVYYKYNYTFKLAGRSAAHKVTLAGDFNYRNPDDIMMVKKNDVWEQQMYLSDDKHTYNFIVDGNWITDPANPVKEKDGGDTLRSVINLGTGGNFRLSGYPNAKKVFLAGNFNGWKPEDLKMQRTGSGWALPYPLPAGNYNYKFIVDGNWITDPQNRCYALEDGVVNSFVSVKPNHIFKLKGYKNNKIVKLIGSFSKWENGEYTLAHKGDEWVIELHLKPGKYRYKFIVDNKQIADPTNKLYEPDDNGDNNSVLWIE